MYLDQAINNLSWVRSLRFGSGKVGKHLAEGGRSMPPMFVFLKRFLHDSDEGIRGSVVLMYKT